MPADRPGDGSVSVAARDGDAALTLTVGTTSLMVLPEVGVLGASLCERGREFLDLHGGAAAARSGHTTGLPLLAPWANRLEESYRVGTRTVDLRDLDLHRDANGLPIHGTMVGRPGWELVSVRTATAAASATFRFDATTDDAVMAAFPFAHELVVGFAIAPGRVTVSTTLAATGTRAVPVAFGWHPYFVLPDTPRGRIRLGLPARHRILVDDRGLPTGDEVAEPASVDRVGDRSFDDGYRLGHERRFVLAAGRRRLGLAFDRNYPFAQVYTPPDSESIAVEPMTAMTDALARGTTPMVAPGERFTARFAISPV